ncbi:MAG: glycosyltransferase [Acidobacteriota bacterium]
MAPRLKLAIILVHYYTPELAQQALAAVGADTADLEVDVESIIVDNGSAPEDRALLSSLDAAIVRPGENLGYAGAVNLGVSRTDAELLVFMNPDVLVRRGCLPRLVGLLRDGAAAAGPRFWWDDDCTMLLPPTERRALMDEGFRALASRSRAWARRARRRWRAHAMRHWRATEALASHDLSGGLLAVSRDAWERVGRFDEGYRLYFEETDWLQRLRKAGLPALYEPRAEAVHRYARSAAREPLAESWFMESERRFRMRHFSPAGRRLLDRLAIVGRRAAQTMGEPPAAIAEPPSVPCLAADGGLAAWVELAPGDTGFPAASARLDGASSFWAVPRSIWRTLPPGRYTLQTVSDTGRELLRVPFSVGDVTRRGAPPVAPTER